MHSRQDVFDGEVCLGPAPLPRLFGLSWVAVCLFGHVNGSSNVQIPQASCASPVHLMKRIRCAYTV